MASSKKVFLLDDEDFAVHGESHYYAITTSLADHLLAYRINQALSSNLHRTREDHAVHKKEHVFFHATYQWYDKRMDRHWVLLNNIGYTAVDPAQAGFFRNPLRDGILPKTVKADYILQVTEEIEDEEINDIRKLLSTVSGVVVVTDYSPPNNAIKEALHVELENTQVHE